MSSRKIYSRDFKLKVLEYYFKHGGDKKFGNRAKTAHHFCIDHKTVSRMLCNTDIVKKARRTLGKKNSSSGCKPPKPPSLKLMGPPFGGVKEVGGTVSDGSSSEGRSPPHPSSSKVLYTSPQEKKQSSPEVPVIELPEDPDFSLLKKTIESSASSAAHIARLLLTGTQEVKRILTNECDLVFECRVCRNLFRSIVNFLAHKRVYCQEEHSNVRSLFHKDTGLNMSSESSTVLVEPEPPPPDDRLPLTDASDRSELKIDRIASRLASRKRKPEKALQEQSSSSTHRGSSTYFRKLHEVNEERKSHSSDCSVLLQDIAGVSSAVYQTFVPPNTSKAPDERIGDIVKEVHQRKRDQPVQLDPDGMVVKRRRRKPEPLPSRRETPSSSSVRASVVAKEVEAQQQQQQQKVEEEEEEEAEVFPCTSEACSSSFSSQKLLTAHVEEIHGVERTIYTCPICNMVFLSIWGCVKHLIRIHKKKKHQRERLKHVICSRAYKKLFTAKDIARHSHKSTSQVAKLAVEKKKEEEIAAPSRKEGISRLNLPASEEPPQPPAFVRNKTPIVPHSCPRCGQTFQTTSAVTAHRQYCPLASRPNNFQSETPEKKIGIQIRKDYRKESPVVAPVVPQIQPVEVTPKDEKLHVEIQARIKEVCVLKRLFCIPCKRKYHTITVLRRHAAQHIGWTRFACDRCPLRSYDKYVCTQHCINVHKATDKNIDRMIRKEERLGTLQYYLPPSRENKLGDTLLVKQIHGSRKKSEYVQNGDYSSSSECSASVVSDDSISLKSEFENNDMESANVAYRELIEVVDVNSDSRASSSEGKVSCSDTVRTENTKEMRPFRIQRETRSSCDARELRDGVKDNKEIDSKLDRPQRVRKTVEQKDFVYEPLRSTLSTSTITPLAKESEQRPTAKRKVSSPPKEPLKRRYLRNSVDGDSDPHSMSVCNGTDGPPSVAESKEAALSGEQKNRKTETQEMQIINVLPGGKKEPSGSKAIEGTKIIINERLVIHDKGLSNCQQKGCVDVNKSKGGEELCVDRKKEPFEDQNKNVSETKTIVTTKKGRRESVEEKIKEVSEDKIKVVSEDKIKPLSPEKIKELLTAKKILDTRNESAKEKKIEFYELKTEGSLGLPKTNTPESKKELPKNIQTESFGEDKNKETQHNDRKKISKLVTSIIKEMSDRTKIGITEMKVLLEVKKDGETKILSHKRGETSQNVCVSSGDIKRDLPTDTKTKLSIDKESKFLIDKKNISTDKKSELCTTRKIPADKTSEPSQSKTGNRRMEFPVENKIELSIVRKRESLMEKKGETSGEKRGDSSAERKRKSTVEKKGESPVERKGESSAVEKKSESSEESKIESSAERKRESPVEKKGPSSAEERIGESPIDRKKDITQDKEKDSSDKKDSSEHKRRDPSERNPEISECKKGESSQEKRKETLNENKKEFVEGKKERERPEERRKESEVKKRVSLVKGVEDRPKDLAVTKDKTVT